MKKWLLVLIPATILLQTSLAQTTTTFKISSASETPRNFKYLLLPNSEISKNDTINELVVDLAEPWLLDSMIEHKRQHHKVFMVGWFIHAFGGYNWRAVDMKKQKFVGTVKRQSRSGAIEYSEYDINFHMHFHLAKYFDKLCVSCDLQKKFHRQDIRRSHRTDYTKEPFVRSKENINPLLYNLEAELTPPYSFIPQLNYLFFPTIPGGGDLKSHPNFLHPHPTMGFYGVSCLDCNHNCHPEIHPYEMTWWLRATDEDSSLNKTWHFGIFHEHSKRMKKWSINPMTGQIKIPFAFRTGESEQSPEIKIEHLVFNKFRDDQMSKMSLPANLLSTKDNNQSINFSDDDCSIMKCAITFDKSITTDGIKYWFSDLNYDKLGKIVSGYFNLAVSVEDLYTTRITFITQRGKQN